MKYYFAPLEGITGYIYRRAHHALYPGLDRYYTPFIVPKEKRDLNTRERNDVLPEHNEGMTVIPQILTNKSEDFLRTASVLQREYGYMEINLNLGCPSKTVVSKKRGSGFLSVPEQLDAFLDEVCSGLEQMQMKLSVKTRIGKYDAEEFPCLLEIFGRYPLSELIVHPRVQKDFYDNTPNLEAFSLAYKNKSGNSALCYNGDIFHVADCEKICSRFPKLSAVMMGRGLLQSPSLAEEIKVRENSGRLKTHPKAAFYARFSDDKNEKDERKRRYELHRRLLEDYSSVTYGEKNVLFKMKELWLYMSQDFTNSKQYWKKMKKAQRLTDFEAAAEALCREEKLQAEI